jgi:hypothetical protein
MFKNEEKLAPEVLRAEADEASTSFLRRRFKGVVVVFLRALKLCFSKSSDSFLVG